MAASTLLPRSAADRPSWPLTGRHAELDSVLDGLRSDTGKAVLVTGAPGVGKSRLAREALDRLATDGWTTTWVAAGPATRDTPLGAVSHLLPRGRRGRSRPGRRARTFRGRAHTCASWWQWTTCSSSTTPRCRCSGRSWRRAPARLLVTVPEAALAPDPLGGLWRSGRARVVELGRLDDLAVDTLLHRALGGPVAGATTLAFLDASDGNALYLREMVLGSLTAGRAARGRRVSGGSTGTPQTVRRAPLGGAGPGRQPRARRSGPSSRTSRWAPGPTWPTCSPTTRAGRRGGRAGRPAPSRVRAAPAAGDAGARAASRRAARRAWAPWPRPGWPVGTPSGSSAAGCAGRTTTTGLPCSAWTPTARPRRTCSTPPSSLPGRPATWTRSSG